MNYEDLTSEQKEKLKACKTPEDILALAKAEGYDLSDDELNSVSGGISWEEASDAFQVCHDKFKH